MLMRMVTQTKPTAANTRMSGGYLSSSIENSRTTIAMVAARAASRIQVPRKGSVAPSSTMSPSSTISVTKV